MKKRNNGKLFIAVSLVCATILLMLMSPFFSVDEIYINGNEKFSDNEILKMAGINTGMNIFKLTYRNSTESLMENTYIKSADVRKNLPNKIEIDIIERKTCGYVPYMGTYLYIDQDGFVLDNKSETDEKCPIVTGLKFQAFSIGEKLAVENTNSFDVVMTMSRLLLNYNYLDYVKEMNISDPEDIHLYVDNIDISFGTIEDIDRKMRIAIEAVKAIPKNDKGILIIDNINNTPYFSYTL